MDDGNCGGVKMLRNDNVDHYATQKTGHLHLTGDWAN